MEFIENNKLSQKKMALWYSLAIFFVILDRFLKIISIKYINFAIIRNFLDFSVAKNYFIAFSIPITGIILNYLILAILIILIYSFFKSKNYIKLSLFFVILGASSNLFDRFKYGYVIDYLNLKWFTIFNVADIMIVLSITYLLIQEFKKSHK